MRSRIIPVLAAGITAACLFAAATNNSADRVKLIRTPHGGIQPQVLLDGSGTLHLLYYSGDAKAGDLYYVRSRDGGTTFSTPVRVNSQPASAIAAGTIRGGQLAIGRNGRVFVAWNGSGAATPKGLANPETKNVSSPMLFARMNDAGTAFEPQRNLMHLTTDLDGGGTVAADTAGNVWVAWHGHPVNGGAPGEAGRRPYIATSKDDGKTFSAEAPAWTNDTGACGCCGMKLFATKSGTLLGLYRSATEGTHRDMYLLSSRDHGAAFQGAMVQKWDINACPMSSEDFTENGATTAAAWETASQVYWSPVSDGKAQRITPAPGQPEKRKHPRLAINQAGETMMVWTEGTGFGRGGSLAWQSYDSKGAPIGDHGTAPGIPAFSFAAVFARPDGGWTILY